MTHTHDTSNTPYDVVETVNGVMFGYTYDHTIPGPLIKVFNVSDGSLVGSAQYDHNHEQIRATINDEPVDVNYYEFESNRAVGYWIANISFN